MLGGFMERGRRPLRLVAGGMRRRLLLPRVVLLALWLFLRSLVQLGLLSLALLLLVPCPLPT